MMVRKSSWAKRTGFLRIWKANLFLFILVLCFGTGCGSDEDNSTGATAYECPAEKTINCMPPVLPGNEALCSGDYHDWIVANCPDVTFTN
jgi:hypothetical protein